MNLGALSKLPPEIRFQIWDYFSLLNIVADTELRQTIKAIASLLRTSRGVNREISVAVDQQYGQLTIRFTISQRRFYAEVVHRNDVSVVGKRDFQSLADARSRGFKGTPYHKFSQVEIHIYAPSANDRSSIILIWKKAQILASLLENAQEYVISIQLLNAPDSLDVSAAREVLSRLRSRHGRSSRDVPEVRQALNALNVQHAHNERYAQIGRWLVGEWPRRSLEEWTVRRSWINQPDYVIALLPLTMLSHARSASVLLPKNMQVDEAWAERLLRRLMSSDNNHDHPCDSSGDPDLDRQRWILLLDLDLELDTNPGACAANLRRDRFRDEYSRDGSARSDYLLQIDEAHRLEPTASERHPRYRMALRIDIRDCLFPDPDESGHPATFQLTTGSAHGGSNGLPPLDSKWCWNEIQKSASSIKALSRSTRRLAFDIAAGDDARKESQFCRYQGKFKVPSGFIPG